MPDSQTNFRLTIHHVLVPLSLISLVVFLFLAFQTMQVIRDRDTLNVAKGQQEQSLQQSQKLQSQLSALVMGTQKLAEQGNKNAKVITDRLKELGVQIEPPGQQKGGTAGAPPPSAQAPMPGQQAPMMPQNMPPNTPVKP